MKAFKLFFISLLITFSSLPSAAQLDSILDGGKYRTFIVFKPSTYNPGVKYPLLLNLHGLNSSASEQMSYSMFNFIADTAGYIVVYPNAENGSWEFAGNKDVDFITHLIDTMKGRYSLNSCLFSTGMSMGAFMTYKLSCVLPQLTAIAVVSGNMANATQNTCGVRSGLPVMHFHGTDDKIVSYNGAIGIPPVDSTIRWWVRKNGCTPTPTVTAMPDLVLTDSSTVERQYFGGGVQGSEVTLYKIIGGGHTWPGAIDVPPLGPTNKDINASLLMNAFFKKYCRPTTTGTGQSEERPKLVAYPNPASHEIALRLSPDLYGKAVDIEIYDATGRSVLRRQDKGEEFLVIDISSLKAGIYFIRAAADGLSAEQKLIIEK